MDSVGQRYGYLAITRAYGGLLSYPDGKDRIFEDHEKAEKTWNAWVAENLLPKAMEEERQRREAFIEDCTWTEEKIKLPGVLTPDRVVRHVLDPDGEVIGDPDVVAFDEIVEKVALERFPEPNVLSVAGKSAGGVEKRVIWTVGLYVDGEFKHLPPLPSWSFGLPIEGVLEILNELAKEGWSVSHVSEDRGVYRGATNQTDSAITTARYLLVHNP